MARQDLDAVLAIEQAIYPFPWTGRNFSDSLGAGYQCWVCEAGGELVAYAVMMVAVDEAHLLNISVAGARQGRGHGRALLSFMLDLARRLGAAQVLLEVRPSNTRGRRLYERFGFRTLAVRRGYYPAPGGREDALLLSIDL